MKEKSPKFEIIIDGKVVKTIKGWERLENEENKFYEKLYDLDYSEEQSSSSGSHGFKLYFNEKTLKSIVWAWRELTDFVDKNGEAIYYGDDIVDEDGLKYNLNEYPFEENRYYISSTNSKPFIPVHKTDITAEEIKERFLVVHNIFPTIKNNK